MDGGWLGKPSKPRPATVKGMEGVRKAIDSLLDHLLEKRSILTGTSASCDPEGPLNRMRVVPAIFVWLGIAGSLNTLNGRSRALSDATFGPRATRFGGRSLSLGQIETPDVSVGSDL